jgi:hypothetical protein
MKTLLCVFVLAALALAAPADVNLTGKWTGSFAIEGQQAEQGGIVMHLKQTGTAVSGTVGPSEEEQVEILQGKFVGDKLTLAAKRNSNDVKIELTLTGDRLKGVANLVLPDRTATAKIDAGRDK